jgi:hypothetical protein
MAAPGTLASSKASAADSKASFPAQTFRLGFRRQEVLRSQPTLHPPGLRLVGAALAWGMVPSLSES